ncbi:MAG: protocatechuate 4,5-dioxygenase alpha subunit / protocatechuate 4,5-dioxygenase beta subunit [Pseudomonadota bacterium]|jgi:gallate dioxygenase
MARIVGGLGASHSPTIGFAKDTNKQNDPAWAPIFEDFARVRRWVQDRKIDVFFLIYNDHVTSFFFDHYSAFALGVGDIYHPADEGGGPRKVAPLRGHAELARHIGAAMVADEFDMSFFQRKALDHGCLSPLSMMGDENGPWPGRIVPLQVGVLQVPTPNARRCYRLGKTLRKAIRSFPDDNLRVAIFATGGLSHQVHGERAGFLNEAWDSEFLHLLETAPEKLAEKRIAEYATLGGMEGAEVITWLIMRGALSDKVRKVHSHTYAPSVTNLGTLVFEDLGDDPDPAEMEAYRKHIGHEFAGADQIKGTYPFTLERSFRCYRINDFLHRIVEPAHRKRFLEDFEGLADEYQITQEERALIRDRKWIEMIRMGVSFFVLEKMAALIGVSNPEIYASMRGETLEQFLKTRKVPIRYSVAGGDKAQALDANKPAPGK